MRFDIVVGNPPYGEDKAGSSNKLHLKIMKSSLQLCTDRLCFIMPSKPIVKRLETEWYLLMKRAVCTDIIPMGRDIFPTTNMENTAVYFIDRKADNDSYCRRLDVDEVIYNMIDDESHRLFIDRMGAMECIRIFIPYNLHGHRPGTEYYENEMTRLYNKMSKDKYYINVNRANVAIGNVSTRWFSKILGNIGVCDREEEIKVCREHIGVKNILECRNRDSAENLERLLKGVVLRYGLWLASYTRYISNDQFKYVPDIDYTNIHTDEELLYACGFMQDEIEKVMKYLENFDFSKNRNDLIRNYN